MFHKLSTHISFINSKTILLKENSDRYYAAHSILFIIILINLFSDWLTRPRSPRRSTSRAVFDFVGSQIETYLQNTYIVGTSVHWWVGILTFNNKTWTKLQVLLCYYGCWLSHIKSQPDGFGFFCTSVTSQVASAPLSSGISGMTTKKSESSVCSILWWISMPRHTQIITHVNVWLAIATYNAYSWCQYNSPKKKRFLNFQEKGWK